jgi:Cdc6-like AAA superfamily ATPase
MEVSRKRKHSDGEANARDAFGQRGSGHTYTGITNSGHSKNHLGDSYTVNNYRAPPPSAECLEAERHKTFMEALAFQRMEYRERAVEHAYLTTCQWILKEEAFLRWRNPAFRETNQGMFWIKGKPGSGKSTLMRYVLEHIRRHPGACTISSFFFNARGQPLEKSTEGCYRTLLHQLLQQVPRLLKMIRVPAVLEKGRPWPVEVLQDILREAMLLLQQDPLVLVIDALDECDEKDIRDMVRFLEDLTNVSHLNGVTLWICLASRHYPSISTRFCESLVVEAAYDHTEDVRNYVQGRLNVEPIAHRHPLSEELFRRSEGVFLWAVLVVRNINEAFDRGATQGQLRDHLSNVPNDLDLLIGSIIAGRASDGHCLPALLWLLSGTQYMDLRSLYYGIRLGAGTLVSPRRDSCVADVATMVRFIVNVSGGLIEIDGVTDREDNQHDLQFIHESVRQHILRGGLASLDSRLSRNVAPNSHAMLLEWCLAYIELPLPFRTDFPIDNRTRKPAWDKLVGDHADRRAIRYPIVQSFPFIDYISESMLHHMDAAFAGRCYDLDRLYDFPLQDWISIKNATMNEGANYVPSTSLLHLLLEDQDVSDAGIIKGILECYPPKGSMMLQPDEESTETFQKCISKICI